MSLKGELTVHANNGLHLSMTRAGMCSLHFAPALSATSGDCRAVTLLVEVAWFPATVPTEHPPLASTACGIVLGGYVIGFSPGAAAPLGSTLKIDGPGGRSMDLGQVPQLGCYSTLVVVVRRSGQIEASFDIFSSVLPFPLSLLLLPFFLALVLDCGCCLPFSY